MLQCLPCLLVILAIADGRPQQDLQDSITSVIKSLEATEPLQRTRPRIITKYDFMSSRDKKSHIELPPEFVVSTGLTVTQQKQNEAPSQRSGRSQRIFGSRQAKTNFVNLKEAVAAAPLVNGVRLPDDESDRVVHRNGRFINNVFIPNEPTLIPDPNYNNFLPMEFVVRTEVGGNSQKKQLERTGRSYQSHDEGFGGSAYTFQPATNYPVQTTSQGANVLPASQDDFVIEQRTYQSCPGCPTFNIPVPVPKSSTLEENQPFLSKRNSVMDRIMKFLEPALKTARGFLKGNSVENSFANRVSVEQEKELNVPMYAGMAVIGLGLAATLLSSGVAGGRSSSEGRRLDDELLESLNYINNELFDYDNSDNNVVDYDMRDILCMPRNYCEKLQRKKYLIDQYPNMKTVASWLAKKYFERVDVSEKHQFSQCNIRDCVMTLLH